MFLVGWLLDLISIAFVILSQLVRQWGAEWKGSWSSISSLKPRVPEEEGPIKSRFFLFPGNFDGLYVWLVRKFHDRDLQYPFWKGFLVGPSWLWGLSGEVPTFSWQFMRTRSCILIQVGPLDYSLYVFFSPRIEVCLCVLIRALFLSLA